MKKKLLWSVIPLVVAGILVAVFAVRMGSGHNPRFIPSPLVGETLPRFSLATLDDPGVTVTPAELPRKAMLINVFASWCVACTDESRTLDWLASHGVTIYGLDYSDTRKQVRAWLERWGNPYSKILFDPHGEAAVAFGIWGVPETYVVDANGRIRHKFTGVIDLQTAKNKVLPLIRKLGKES